MYTFKSPACWICTHFQIEGNLSQSCTGMHLISISLYAAICFLPQGVLVGLSRSHSFLWTEYSLMSHSSFRCVGIQKYCIDKRMSSQNTSNILSFCAVRRQLLKYRYKWDTQHQQPPINAVISHIFSHVVRIMLPLCDGCVSPVSWTEIRWCGLGWARRNSG